MITVHLAEQLDHLRRSQGHPWEPVPGDRFVIPGHHLDGVFVVAEMAIEVTELSSGRLVRFNGTTEWALDSIPAEEVLWLPWEHQVREMLGERLASLERRPDEWVVTLADGTSFVGTDPETAYARAVVGEWPPYGPG